MAKPIYEVRFPEETEEGKIEEAYKSLFDRMGNDYHIVVMRSLPFHQGVETRILSPKKSFWQYLFNRE